MLTFFLDRIHQAARGAAPSPDGRHTIGDLVRSVLAIETADDARQFHVGYIDWLRTQTPHETLDAEQIAAANIGWCFGEGMSDARRAMWREATGAAHPVFGAMETRPTTAAGMKLAAERVQSC